MKQKFYIENSNNTEKTKMSVIVKPMKLSEILEGKKAEAQSTPRRKQKKLKTPGAPKAPKKSKSVRSLFGDNVASALKKKKKKKATKLPKTLYIVMNDSTKSPVSVHKTSTGAQKTYWASLLKSSDHTFSIVACQSGKD